MADNKLPFALSFERQYAGPLDPTTVFDTYAEMQAYLTNETRYAGQIAFCNEDGTLHYLANRDSWLPVHDQSSIYDAIDSMNARLDMTMTAEQILLIESAISEQIGFNSDSINYLQTELEAKAATAHTHEIANVAGLQTALDGKAATVHTHTIANVTGLQTALDGKAATSHTHTIANVTNLQTTLNGKAATAHTHEIANVTGLQTELDAKAATAHTHNFNDIEGIGGIQNGLNITPGPNVTEILGNEAMLVRNISETYKFITPNQLKAFTLGGLNGKVFSWSVTGTETTIEGLIEGNIFQLKITLTDTNAPGAYTETLDIFGPLTKGTVVYQSYESKIIDIGIGFGGGHSTYFIFEAFRHQNDQYSDGNLFIGNEVGESFASLINYSDSSRTYYSDSGVRPSIDSAKGVKLFVDHAFKSDYNWGTGFIKREMLFIGTIQNWEL